jgi:hypothetical protein
MTINAYAKYCYAECHNQVHYAECHQAESCYPECRSIIIKATMVSTNIFFQKNFKVASFTFALLVLGLKFH